MEHAWRNRLIAIGGFPIALLTWRWASLNLKSPSTCLLAMFLPLTLVPLVSLAGRLFLKPKRTLADVKLSTTLVHYGVAIPMGVAIIAALKTAQQWRYWPFLFPQLPAKILLAITGAAVAWTILNLAWRGLGAPFGIVLSHRLATDWAYRYSRNPMVVTLTGFFISLSLWLRSGLFLFWVVVALLPAEIFFLRFYEERELELRFGQQYRSYKARTPMFVGFRKTALLNSDVVSGGTRGSPGAAAPRSVTSVTPSATPQFEGSRSTRRG
ncbi:MAG TPA: methyltransferase [Terriglobales bacterium]|nr:methyltransferase [Terriglobales bacterium]